MPNVIKNVFNEGRDNLGFESVRDRGVTNPTFSQGRSIVSWTYPSGRKRKYRVTLQCRGESKEVGVLDLWC
jgi:hypothetical protein